MRLELVEPRLERQHRFAPQAEDAEARVVRDALVGDEACLEQDPQMSAHDRGGGPGGLSQLAGAARPFAEQLDHPSPGWIGERWEESLHVVLHIKNSYEKPQGLSSR
jgi:hypothetical protein